MVGGAGCRPGKNGGFNKGRAVSGLACQDGSVGARIGVGRTCGGAVFGAIDGVAGAGVDLSMNLGGFG